MIRVIASSGVPRHQPSASIHQVKPAPTYGTTCWPPRSGAVPSVRPSSATSNGPGAVRCSRVYRTAARSSSGGMVSPSPYPVWVGITPSHRAARRNGALTGHRPPHQTGILGRCTGRGSMVTSVAVRCSPRKVTGSLVHRASSKSSDSSSRAARSFASPGSPNAVNSSARAPSPAPTTSRPCDNWSSVTDSRATLPTRRRASRFTRIPILIRAVRAATAAMTTTGSATYHSGSHQSW